MTHQDPAIRATDLTLILPVIGMGRRKRVGVHQAQVGGTLMRDSRGRVSVKALAGVNFQIERGDSVGLIGRNGAGKSSLLRVMAGIYPPTHGACEVRGKVSTLFTANLGLNNTASGRENIRLIGGVVGLTEDQIDARMDEIIEFCQLGDYIDLPLHTYSNGMRTRVGFAVATSVDADVLLIDEVFGTGDRAFRDHAAKRVEKLIEESSTIVMAVHSENMLRQFCNKVMWVEHGHIRAFGPTEEVLQEYQKA